MSSEQPCEPKSLHVAWKLRELKKYPRKTCGSGQPRGHFIRVLNERSVLTVEILVFCSWWFSNQFDIVSETLSCDTVGRELWLAILISSLLCPETDRNSRIGKQGYVFILSDFKKWCFDVSFLTSISVSTVNLTLGKVDFFLNKLINLRTILLIGFVKFEIKQWSRGGGGYFQKNWVGVCGPLPKKNPIHGLTKNSKPNLWPDPRIKILFQTCILITWVVP